MLPQWDSGDPRLKEEIERYRRVFAYDGTFSEATRY